MKNGKKSLLLGVIIGVVLSYFFFNYFAPRYEIKKTATLTMKVDKWTGDSWRLVDNNWKKMSDMDENWELIDKTISTYESAVLIVAALVVLGFLRKRIFARNRKNDIRG